MAGLPWIELHTDLPEHPKSIRLGIILGDEWAWKYMVRLWTWAAVHLQSGQVDGEQATEVIERGASWRGTPGEFVAAASACGYLDCKDDSISIHEWSTYALAHIIKREKDAARKRKKGQKVARKFATKRARTLHRNSDGSPPEGERISGGGPSEIQRNNNNNNNNNPYIDKERVASSADADALAGEHRATVDTLDRVYAEARSTKYRWAPRDFAAVKRLRREPLDEVERRWRNALASTGSFWTCDSVTILESRWNDYRETKSTATPPVTQRRGALPPSTHFRGGKVEL